jgi:hypothetical protein
LNRKDGEVCSSLTKSCVALTLEIGSNDVKDMLAATLFAGDPRAFQQVALDSIELEVQALHDESQSHPAGRLLLASGPLPEIGPVDCIIEVCTSRFIRNRLVRDVGRALRRSGR